MQPCGCVYTRPTLRRVAYNTSLARHNWPYHLDLLVFFDSRLFVFSPTIPANTSAIEKATIELANIVNAMWQLVTPPTLPFFQPMRLSAMRSDQPVVAAAPHHCPTLATEC